MEHHTTTTRAEAERLLGIAEKLLRTRDFNGSRDFAILAKETEPLIEGSEQILAVAEVHLAAASKKLVNGKTDWYSVLQVPQRTDDADLIRKQYRRLALLLHPDKNKFPFSDSAFGLVADALAVLSDPDKKSAYDNEFVPRFTKVDPFAMKKQKKQVKKQQPQHREENSHDKLPVRRSPRGKGGSGFDGGETTPSSDGGTRAQTQNTAANSGFLQSFWTVCPYCYNLHEYSRVYVGCCLRCENCKRAFTASEILSMPPMVPGKEAYYCCWGFFPMGFTAGNVEARRNGFPKWMPPMFESVPPAEAVVEDVDPPPQNATPVDGFPKWMPSMFGSVPADAVVEDVDPPPQNATPVDGFPKWMPSMFGSVPADAVVVDVDLSPQNATPVAAVSTVGAASAPPSKPLSVPPSVAAPSGKKRGRPRKNI